MSAGLDEVKSTLAAEISKVLPSKKGIEALKTSSDGVKIANFVEETKRKYNID